MFPESPFAMKPNDFDTIHNISPGRHFYQFYKSTEDYLQVVLPYFQSGLGKGEACLWLVSREMGTKQMCDIALAAIHGCENYLNSGQFQMSEAENWYLKNGNFDEPQASRNAVRYVEDCKKRGFSVIRGAGDAAAIPEKDWPLLESYERNMASFIKSASLIALCAYPILRCSLKETKTVIDCHDDVLVGRI